MDDFYHVIVTHFNVRKFNTPLDGNYVREWGEPLSDEWLSHRIRLFEQYCYPSISKQVCQNFDWFVYFDGLSTDRELFKKYERITPIYIEEPRGFNVQKDLVAKLRESGKLKKWLMTTHLDNDDSLSVNYVTDMQRRFKNNLFQHNISEPMFSVNYNHGLFFEVASSSLRRKMYQRNPYMTTIELSTENRKIETCWIDAHQDIHKKMNIRSVRNTPPMWMQIIHENNFRNYARGRKIPFNYEMLKKEFGLNLTMSKPVKR
jgi:hypothetical protein